MSPLRIAKVHAVRNLLQVVLGSIELGELQRAEQAVRDIDLVLGAHPVPWTKCPHTVQFSSSLKCTISPQPDRGLSFTLEDTEERLDLCWNISSAPARDLADLMISYADLSDLAGRKKGA
jgi:hypothetical protein